MSLASRIGDLAIAIRDKINAMMPRLLPAGGTTGQVLAKASNADHAVGWQTVSGGGGSQQVFVQETRPVVAGPWTWWVTNASGAIINLIVNDGA